PGHGISRAQLAAEVLGDSHGLDNGRPVATIMLRAFAAETSIDATEAAELQNAEESVRERWARLGITVNELALPALCLNLPCLDTDVVHRQLQQAIPLDRSPGLVLSPGEPAHISLRSLLRRPPTWHVAQREVFVCENPNIVAIAADRLGPACAPLACTDGMPSAAQQTLLAQLAAGGAQLRYHGDFDWAGLVIGNFVMRAFGAKPWRFGTPDYLSATADHRIALRGNKPVVARWDDRLASAMSERRVAVHEEGVVETLLIDLAANRLEFEK
ncbi:MAG: TIGR02679 family protein, partial [Steroidobacteraceae bacterium]